MDRRKFLRSLAAASALGCVPIGCTTMKREKGMKLDNLAMPPYNTTYMGVVTGALGYYQIDVSAPMAFGTSGHAFLINIHEQLCPSGPYCWNRGIMDRLLENPGLRMTYLGFYSPQNGAEERTAVEKKLRDALDKRIACSLLNLENQMITGYDETGFFTVQPWAPKVDFPPARLAFGSWKELGDSFHLSFYTIEKVKPANQTAAILAGLDYAVDLFAHPPKHSQAGYGIGPDAYSNWIKAAPEFGTSHGNWWNATVWSECRRMASEFFTEIQQKHATVSQPASELSADYAAISEALAKASDKEMNAAEKVALLRETNDKEAAAIEKVAALAARLRSGTRG